MTTKELLTIAGNMPLHDPARAAIIAAAERIDTLQKMVVKAMEETYNYKQEAIANRQSLDYANAALLPVSTDRANLLCACARIAYGVGTADEYSKTARAAIAGLVDREAEAIDKTDINEVSNG